MRVRITKPADPWHMEDRPVEISVEYSNLTDVSHLSLEDAERLRDQLTETLSELK